MGEEAIRRSLVQIRSQFNRLMDAVENAEDLHELGVVRQRYLERYDEYCQLPQEQQRSSVQYDKRAMDLAWNDAVQSVMRPRNSSMNGNDSTRQQQQRQEAEEGELDRHESTGRFSQDDLAVHLARAVDRMNISYSFIFDSEPAQYVKFITYFERRFSSKSFDEYELMSHLIKSTSGKALSAIQHYEGIDGGYNLAMKVLERRFGKPFEIVERTMNKVSVGPRFKPDDVDGLNLYASQLEGAYETLRAHGATVEANSEQFLVKIFNRLPQNLQQKWLGENQKIRESKLRNPKFRELVQFIIRMADMSDSVYKVKPNFQSGQRPTGGTGGGQPGIPRLGTSQGVTGTRVTTLASEMSGSGQSVATPGGQLPNQNSTRGKKCVCCNGEHHVAQCPDFGSWNYRQRRSLVQGQRLCYRCLDQHMARACTRGELCTELGCHDERPHHRLLHRDPRPQHGGASGGTQSNDTGRRGMDQTSAQEPPKSQSATPDSAKSNGPSEQSQKANVHAASRMESYAIDDSESFSVLLQIVPVKISVGNRSVSTLAMIDSGSQGTLVDKQLMRLLDVQGHDEKLKITTVTGTSEDIDVSVFSCQIAPLNSDERFIDVPRMLAVDRFPLESLTLPCGVEHYPHLKDVPLAGDVDIDKVSILIGQDVPAAHMPLETRFGDNPAHEPYAVRSLLGWSIAGPARKSQSGHRVLANFLDVEQPGQTLDSAVRKLWDLERHGFVNDDRKCPSVEDKRCLETLENRTRCVEGRYEAPMLWKRDPPNLPNSRPAAEKRLAQLIRRFWREPEFYERYKQEMDEYIKNGYARRMLKSEAELTTPKTWYLPHHAVFNLKKPGKFRIVHDAAAETAGVSLNSELCSGPDLTNSLVGCLLRFRQHEVAVVADVQSMFHRVKCLDSDVDALRFLWIPDGVDSPLVEYQMTSHVFGKKDSPTVCTFALQQCARDQKEKFSTDATTCVHRNFYVDDLLLSLPTEKLAARLTEELISMLDYGGFRLTKFQSNNDDVLKSIPLDRVSPAMSELDFDSELPLTRALGTRWDIESDTIGVKVDETKDFAATRRGCLSQVCTTFDPLGIIAPVTLIGKRILHQASRLKIGWDQPLPDHLMAALLTWRSELQLLDGLSVPRCYFPDSETAELTLHHFSDASEDGYGAVSYLRAEYPDGEVRVAFLTAKSRTTPSNFTTVPRLELQACVVAARLHSFLMRELDVKIAGYYFYTDSTISYQYINSTTKRFHTYVANRTTEFRDLADPANLYVIPGKLNPADEASRGCMPQKFLKNERFLRGPDFLFQPRETWPVTRPGQPLADDSTEVKLERPLVLAIVAKPVEVSLRDLISRYGSWTLLKRKTAYLQKVVDVLSSRYLPDRFKHVPPSLKLTPDDLLRAEKNLVRFVQSECFDDEIKVLKKRQHVSTTSRLRKLNPQLDADGILRVGGRIRHSTLPYDQKFPIILPKSHELTRAVILYYHIESGHSGCNHVLALTRERFWIIHGRAEVRRLVGKCFTCKKYLANKMGQVMADLPDVRTTTYVPPFQEATGIDFLGPFLVKRGRSQAKRYGCLFTCLHTRCVHLEMATGLDTPSFLNCLRRHQSRRGTSKEYWCDNGTNFTGAEREMKRSIDEWNKEQLHEDFVQEGVKFNFLPPYASHMAGVWERLVRSTKRALYGVLDNQFVCDDVLSTAFAETERILNSRPLCPVSSDPNDLEVLTPNHLLLQRTFSNLPPGLFHPADKYKSKFRQAQYLADGIWRRICAEYIPALQERCKWLRPRRNLKMNDVVLVCEKDLPRSRWLIGRITKTFPGKDGKVRSVELKTKSSTLLRPIHKLALLEAVD